MKITLLTLCLYFTSFFFACDGTLLRPCGPYAYYGTAEWTGMELYLNDQDSIVLNENERDGRTMFRLSISMMAKVEMQSQMNSGPKSRGSQVAAYACQPTEYLIYPVDSISSLHFVAARAIFDTIVKGDTLDCYTNLIMGENQGDTFCQTNGFLQQQMVSPPSDEIGYFSVNSWIHRDLAIVDSALSIIVNTQNQAEYSATL